MRASGYCPMGCGETLFVDANHSIVCSSHECPRPTAVHELLSEPMEHVVRLHVGTWTVKHPLRERLDGALFDCALPEVVKSLYDKHSGLVLPGTYRATPIGDERDRSGLVYGGWRLRAF